MFGLGREGEIGFTRYWFDHEGEVVDSRPVQSKSIDSARQQNSQNQFRDTGGMLIRIWKGLTPTFSLGVNPHIAYVSAVRRLSRIHERRKISDDGAWPKSFSSRPFSFLFRPSLRTERGCEEQIMLGYRPSH